MDDELVEKVARGIFEAKSWWLENKGIWEKHTNDWQEMYRRDARTIASKASTPPPGAL